MIPLAVVGAAAGKLRPMKKLFFTILFFLAGATCPAVATTPGEVAVGETLREAVLFGLSGPSRKLSDFRGKPLIINVWASWCGPCQQEMASLERLSHHKGGKQFAVIGISTDDYREAAMAFLKRNRTTFSHYIDRDLFMENMLGADKIPLTLLVDAQGRVLTKVYGARKWDSPEAVKAIEQAFRGGKKPDRRN